MRTNKGIIITIIIMLLIFLMRLPGITNAPPEMGDLWRQPDTESIARNFVDHEFNILRPQFNYDGALPNYIQLEFQITTFIIAVLYKIFGHHYYLARLVPILFFMISVYYLYRLIEKIYGKKAAWITIIIYGIIPINLFYSRAIMPESAALCFFNGAFYYFYKWYKDNRNMDLFISGILTAIAISQKTPAIFIGLAFIFMCIEKYGPRFITRWRLWLFGAIALIPPFAYIFYSGEIAEFKFVSGIGLKHIIPNFTTSVFSEKAMEFYKINLPESFTLLILILAIVGIFTLFSKKSRPLLYLSLSIILEVIFIVSVIKFKYYLIFLAPIIAILAGRTLYLIFSNIRIVGSLVLVLTLTYTGISSYNLVKDDYKVREDIVDFGRIIDENTSKGDLVVIGYPDSGRLSISNRQGWRANIDIYPEIPEGVVAETKYYVDNGVRYFILDGSGVVDDGGAYRRYLDDNFEIELIEEKYRFYKLNE